MEKKLLDILVCPNCKGKLIFLQKTNQLICKFDKLAFMIEDEIPVMLIDQATTLTDDEITTISAHLNES